MIKGINEPATENALAMVRNGHSVHGAAIKVGIHPSTLFRAIARLRAQKSWAKRGARKRKGE